MRVFFPMWQLGASRFGVGTWQARSDRRLGGPGNRFRFRFGRACARPGSKVGMSSKRRAPPRPLSLFPFRLEGSSLFPWRSTLPPNLLSSFSWPYRYVFTFSMYLFCVCAQSGESMKLSAWCIGAEFRRGVENLAASARKVATIK